MGWHICKDCRRCTESGLSSAAKKSANAMLLVGTLGMSAVASKSAGALRRKCPICNHFMSEHSQMPVQQQTYYNTYQQAPPQYIQAPPPVVNVVVNQPPPPPPVPQAPPTPQVVNVRCEYCTRINRSDRMRCDGCGAPVPARPQHPQPQQNQPQYPQPQQNQQYQQNQPQYPQQQATPQKFCRHCKGGNPLNATACIWCHQPIK
jgi:hypothetical protein